MTSIPIRQKPAVPGRNVIDGDVLYFRHPDHGPLCGPVVCVGKDGVTIRHKTARDGLHRVLWDDVLGHKERRVRKLALLERGEDGAIALDEDGKRVFIEGEIPDDDDADEMCKSNDNRDPVSGRYTTAIASAKVKISDLIAQNNAGDSSGTAHELLPVNDDMVRAGKLAGFDFSDHSHAADVYAVRHTKKKHGNPAVEKQRGQLPVTDDVLMSIPEIVSAPDYVVFGAKSANGKDIVAYFKRMPDGAVVHLEEVRSGRRHLALHTMRRYPATIAASSVMTPANLNARSDSGDEFTIIDPETLVKLTVSRAEFDSPSTQNALQKMLVKSFPPYFDFSKSLTTEPDEHTPLLIDIGKLHGESCDCALESLHKALSDEDGLAHNIWAEHEDPFIRALVERFSERGLSKIATVQSELSRWLSGEYHVPVKAPQLLPPGYMGRWTTEQLDLVRIYLQAIPPDALTLDDWSMVIDYLVQRYLPFDVLNEEAEWLAVKSGMMGKVKAHLPTISPSAAVAVSESLPSTLVEAGVMFKLSNLAEATLAYGKLRACDAVQAVSEATRHSLKKVVLDYHRQKLAGAPVSTGDLQSKLLEAFSNMNRDWRRIAVTEAGEIANQGMIAALPPGSRVRRVEMYNGACAWCKKIDGRIFKVVAADAEDKDGDREVWPGKTNLGRSSSPRKRVGNELIERLPSERWWVAAGTQHPHCRGRWEQVQGEAPGDDPEFAAWLQKQMGQVEVV